MESQSIFCPRCGTSNLQRVRFCRQCGLAMAPVTGYLTGEAPDALLRPELKNNAQSELKPHARLLASFTPRQKMVLSIILTVISPALFGVLDLDELTPLAAILMPFVIIFVVFYFRNQTKPQPPTKLAGTTSVPDSISVNPRTAPLYVPPPPQPGAAIEAAFDTDRRLELPAERLNVSSPANLTPGSVTEEETRKLNQLL